MAGSHRGLAADLHLPATLLARYLFFLSRRPISRSNQHYLARRLAGLQSLAPLLRGRGEPRLDHAMDELERLNPVSFGHRVGALEALLAPGLLREPPPDVVVAASPPGPGFLDPVRRATLILGPAIGVGDEILCFAAARWLRSRLPAAEITVLTAYRGLWDRVPEVDGAVCYERFSDLVEAVRGQGPAGPSGLVVLLDFEKPDLAAAVTFEPGVERYMEISLGAGSAVAYEAGARWLYRAEAAGPAARGYYSRLERLLGWLGGSPEGAAGACGDFFAGRLNGRPGDPATLLISPFTSKQEPSLVYWSRLAADLVPASAAARTRLRLDAGPNLTTRRFAAALAEATRAAAPFGLTVEVARGGAGLAEALEELERADAVIASDSYAAHAAPMLGRAALVVAQPGLADWRVPAPRSFYFEDTQPLPGIAAGMRQVLAAAGFFDGAVPRPWSPPAGRRLVAATRSFRAALADGCEGPGLAPLCRGYEELGQALRGVVAGFAHWPRELEAMLADRPYDHLLPPLALGAGEDGRSGADLRLHLRGRFEEWEGSNLHKYLALLERPERETAR
jgi:hypothetical protein